jgi:aldehyde:ferredoxin oxidoreductase
MHFAVAGKILHVDLSTEKIWTEPIPEEWIRKFIGSRGINAKILWEANKPGIDPLGPENTLIFGTGTLSGTFAPTSGRTTVTCKSPTTQLYLKTNVGGHWGTELKFAGYDYLVVHGAAKTPVYLWIDNGKAEIRDARHLWGKDVRETTNLLHGEVGDSTAQVAAIGQGGENLVFFAAVMVSVYNAAARGGAGAVMGSKKLKAVAVRGQGAIRVADSKEFYRSCHVAIKNSYEDATAKFAHLYGTAGSVPMVNEARAFPAYNFRRGYIEGAEKIGGPYLAESKYLKRRLGCNACIFCCHRYCEIKEGKFAGCYTGGPEYETISALGSGCGSIDLEVVIKANELCNIYGLDTISAGNLVQWAMEGYEKKIFTEQQLGGLRLEWGSGDAIVELVRRIAHREGLGNILADGVKRAAEQIGRGSEKWAIQAKGLEQSRVETRAAFGYALAFAVNPRGPDHLHSETIAEFGTRPGGRRLIKKITGDEKYANPRLMEKRAEIVRWHEDCFAATDSLGLCAFINTSRFGVDPRQMADMFSAAIGKRVTEEELMQAGRRILTLEKCFNVREGATRADDTLPWRLMNEPLESLARGQDVMKAVEGKADPADFVPINSPAMLNRMLDEYYALHDWDKQTSWPYRDTLEKLDLPEVIPELESKGKIPQKK